MKKLLIALIGMGIVLIASTRIWMHYFPVEPVSVYNVEENVPPEVITAPVPEPVKVKPKLKQMEKPKLRTRPKPKPSFKCDKRKYCSQMKSYEEAVYFSHNCRGTKMDGDGDGIPCERQFRR